MIDPKHAQMMLQLALKDMKALRGMCDKEVFDDEIFGFHAQQSVEKVLKSWLSFLGISYPKTHDLEELFDLVEDQNQVVPDKFRSLTDFTDFAVQFRYESFEDLGEGEIDREEIVSRVEGFVEYVEQLLKTSSV